MSAEIAATRRPVAVVTGAGRGLGRGIALALASGGFDLVAGWASDERAAEETAARAASLGARTALVGGDVTEPKTADRLADAALSELGSLDAWVNNSGVSFFGPLVSTPVEQMRRMCDVNLLGTFNGLVTAGRMMSELGGGRIVNVASDLGLQAAPLLAGYSATKFAVVGLTQAAAVELAPAGVTVNAVCPGTVETDMVLAEQQAEAALTSSTVAEVRARLLAEVPAGRLCTAEDVGELVAWLAGPGAGHVTGQSICVNGGSIRH